MAEFVQQALSTDLILEHIFELFNFKELKQLRLVNKSWNKNSATVLRKRCFRIQLYDKSSWFKYGDQFSAEFSPESSAKIPIDVKYHVQFYHEPDNFLKELTTVSWRINISRLSLNFFSVEGANFVTPFLLERLPSLKHLEFCFFGGGQLELNEFEPSKISTDSEFDNLVVLRYVQNYSADWLSEVPDQGLDPSFWRHCKNLRTLIIGEKSRFFGVFPALFRLWKQLVSQDTTFPKIPQLTFDLEKVRSWDNSTLVSTEDPVKSAKVLEELVEFISTNEPTTLELLGEFDYDFPTLFQKIGRWTPSIQSVTTLVPRDSRTSQSRADLILRLLKTFDIFENLSQVCFHLPDLPKNRKEAMGLDEAQVKALPIKHQLPNLVSLKVNVPAEHPRYGNENIFDISVLKQAALVVPGISSLSLLKLHINFFDSDSILNAPSSKEDNPIFNVCKKFKGLRHPRMELNADSGYLYYPGIPFKYKLEKIKIEKVGGFLKNLSVLESLKTFQLAICYSEEVDMETVLVALFHGYEPHVPLDFEISGNGPSGARQWH